MLGAGLGLSIVYGIVHRHRGAIEVASERGHGTTIRTSFPLQTAAEPVECDSPQKNPMKSCRVLVVEDEPLVRELLTVYLDQDNHETVTAENGEEGLDKFREGEFDLVLTDRSMPGMDGTQLALAIKKINPAVPVILLTGYGDITAGSEDYPEGVNQVVGKPFTMESLREAISSVLPE
jgi:CheY-like chemotaxis protein